LVVFVKCRGKQRETHGSELDPGQIGLILPQASVREDRQNEVFRHVTAFANHPMPELEIGLRQIGSTESKNRLDQARCFLRGE
jgi:hypothetical protein